MCFITCRSFELLFQNPEAILSLPDKVEKITSLFQGHSNEDIIGMILYVAYFRCDLVLSIFYSSLSLLQMHRNNLALNKFISHMRHRSYVGIDSIHFLNNSLDNLARNLEFFPHDYWDSFQKLKEGLPSKDKFYNILTNCAFSD